MAHHNCCEAKPAGNLILPAETGFIRREYDTKCEVFHISHTPVYRASVTRVWASSMDGMEDQVKLVTCIGDARTTMFSSIGTRFNCLERYTQSGESFPIVKYE